MKVMRLTFLDLGPEVTNLEFFDKLETLLLQHNSFDRIGSDALQFNINLQMINLSNNKLTCIEGLIHLPILAYLDVSNNQIKSVDAENELPPSLQYMRIYDNPVKKEDKDLRKKIVVHCQYLIELDKIKVVQAERMHYMGLLPRSQKINIEEMLEKYKKEREEKEAKERLEYEMYVEMME
jgi:Leucine-rich repeat (LRR) protein